MHWVLGRARLWRSSFLYFLFSIMHFPWVDLFNHQQWERYHLYAAMASFWAGHLQVTIRHFTIWKISKERGKKKKMSSIYIIIFIFLTIHTMMNGWIFFFFFTFSFLFAPPILRIFRYLVRRMALGWLYNPAGDKRIREEQGPWYDWRAWERRHHHRFKKKTVSSLGYKQRTSGS